MVPVTRADSIGRSSSSARIFVGAAVLGGPQFMTPEQVHRIANRIDEHYRQRALKL